MIQSPLPGVPGRDYRITQWIKEDPTTYKLFGLTGHNGIDLAPRLKGAIGVTVFAPHDGFCECYDEGDSGYGQYVEVIDKSKNRKSVLAHLQTFLVSPQHEVKMGDPIGIMGSTGFSSAVHLHWGYKKIDSFGKTENWDNGLKGAIDISQFVTLPQKGKGMPFLVLRDFK